MYRSNLIYFWKIVLGRVIEYHGYITVEDERSIVLHKDLGFMVNSHVEVSEMFLLRGNEYVFYSRRLRELCTRFKALWHILDYV